MCPKCHRTKKCKDTPNTSLFQFPKLQRTLITTLSGGMSQAAVYERRGVLFIDGSTPRGPVTCHGLQVRETCPYTPREELEHPH